MPPSPSTQIIKLLARQASSCRERAALATRVWCREKGGVVSCQRLPSAPSMGPFHVRVLPAGYSSVGDSRLGQISGQGHCFRPSLQPGHTTWSSGHMPQNENVRNQQHLHRGVLHSEEGAEGLQTASISNFVESL